MKSSADPKAKARFAEIGAILLPGSATDFAAAGGGETEKWGRSSNSRAAKVD